MSRTGRIALLPVLIVVLVAGCGSPAATTSAAPATTQPAAVAPAAPSAAPAPAANAATSWVMPDLVGSNLQEAQDSIQKLTDFAIAVTTSHDSTGAGRSQVLDRNWKVCDQSVAAGKKITTGSSIDFGAVKLTESC